MNPGPSRNHVVALSAMIGFAFVAPPPTAHAAGPYDPEVEWFTVTTPNFLVMYPEGYGHIALRAARIAEDSRDYFARRYEWEPSGRISIIIDDQTDSANGSATILPSKTITLFVTAPTRISGLEDYDDWLSDVLIHELSHIYHLDMAYGLPWVGRLFLGKYFAMNQYAPSWVTEGLAVYEETVSSGAGRGRSSYADMVLRTAALEGAFPSIDRGYRSYPNWPFASIAYMFGGRFQLWLAERFGEEALLRYHRIYASNPIPYFTYIPAKLAFDASLESLWIDFAAETLAEAEAVRGLVESAPEGRTTPTRLTRHDGECVGPRITPDGKTIVYSTSSPVDGARVRRMRIDGTDEEVLLDDTLSLSVSFSPKGDAFYFQQTEINQRFYAHNSIFRYDIAKRTLDRLELDPNETDDFTAPSGSLRVRDPDVSRDGKRIVFVQTPYGANRLVLAWLESDGFTIHPKVLVSAEPDVQFSDPRFSPDGTRIAVARFKGGRRDILVYDLDGNIEREITRDRAQDTDPAWSSDGKWLVFSSDRSGIYNLYAYDIATRELRRLTNLLTGAFQPSVSPDQTLVVYRGYSSEGFDVYTIPFAPERAPVVPLELAPVEAVDTSVRSRPPKNAGAPAIPPPAPFKDTPLPAVLPGGWSIAPYSALDTILPFRDNWNVFPAFGFNEREAFGTLSHFGSDARNTHAYAIALSYGTFTKFLGGAAAYTFNELEPSFSISAFADAVTFGNRVFILQDPSMPCEFAGRDGTTSDGASRICPGPNDGAYNERRLGARFSVGLPVRQRHFISLSYRFENRSALDVLPAGTASEVLPRGGNLSRVSLGYTYSNVRSFAHSISLERGPSFALALSGLSRGLGGDYEELIATAEGRYYLSMPWRPRWLSNHVLASRLGVGITAGPDLVQEFRLGGVAGESAISTTTEDFHALRGLRTAELAGTAIISGGMEYRAPLVRIDRGLGTFPLTLRVVHAAAFVDLGRVFDRFDGDRVANGFLDEFAVGVGGEIIGDVMFGWALPLTMRLGYAHAVHTPTSATRDPSANAFYFQVGSIF